MNALKFVAVWVGLVLVCWGLVLLPAWLLVEHPAWLLLALMVAGIVAAGWWALRMTRKRQRVCSHYDRCEECS